MPAESIRIVFMGTPEFAVPSLEALLENGEKVVAVVSQPDRPKGRGRKLSAPPVKELALSSGIPVLQPTKIKGEKYFSQLEELKPDLFVVAAYGRILPGHLLNLPPLGTINVHGSILPKYRGAAPIQWAVINGETETGVTIMQMDEGMDTGDILLTEKIPIEPDDTSGSMMVKLADLGGHALIQTLDLLRDGKLIRTKQADKLATPAPPLKKEQGLITWKESAHKISCLIRGLDPWPTAHTTIEGKRVRLFRPQVIDYPSETKFIEQTIAERGISPSPGILCNADDHGLVIATGKDYLLIQEIQPEGRKRMTVDAFLRGHPLEIGIMFE